MVWKSDFKSAKDRMSPLKVEYLIFSVSIGCFSVLLILSLMTLAELDEVCYIGTIVSGLILLRVAVADKQLSATSYLSSSSLANTSFKSSSGKDCNILMLFHELF